MIFCNCRSNRNGDAMPTKDAVLFQTKPSLRRAYFFASLYLLIVAGGLVETSFNQAFFPLWLSAVALLALLLFPAHLKRWCTSYTITAREVQVSEGIFSRRLAIASHRRITNASASQSILERLLGIVNLNIDTAGGDRTELSFLRINKSDAKKAGMILRKIIDGQESATNSDGTGDVKQHGRN